MISVERFLEQQGLQPVLSEAGGSALSSGRRLQDGRIESGCGQVLCNDEEDTPKRTRHARHAGRVVAGEPLTIRMIWMRAGRPPSGCLMRHRVRQVR